MDPPDSKLFSAISIVSKRPPILSEASNTSIVASGPKSSRRKCDELEPPIPAPMTAMFIGFDLRSAANTDRCLAKKRVGSKKMLALTPKPNARNIFFFSARAVMKNGLLHYAHWLVIVNLLGEQACVTS